MKNTSEISYRELGFSQIGETIQLLEKIFKITRVKCYLIGAAARNIHYIKAKESPPRATKDIDFAIMLDGYRQFEEIRDELIKMNFSQDEEIPYRFINLEKKIILDIIPFGGYSSQDYFTLYDENKKISIVGLREVASHSKKEVLEGGIEIPVAPLEGICLLKLIAWSERPEDREKDIGDIIDMLGRHFRLNREEIIKKHSELFDKDMTVEQIGARVLGRKLGALVMDNRDLHGQIFQLIMNESLNSGNWLERYATTFNTNIENARDIFEELLTGLEEIK